MKLLRPTHFEKFLLRFALYNGDILHVPRAAES